jgi:hypothetical protein
MTPAPFAPLAGALVLVIGCDREPSARPVPPGAPTASAVGSEVPSAAASVTVSTRASVSPGDTDEPAPYPERTTTAWPLDMDRCAATPCTLPDGTAGLVCSPGQRCFNPCPAGLGPERDHWSCAKLCKSNTDCGDDPCRHGVCDRWPRHTCANPQENCTTADGQQGFRCSSRDPCRAMCKRGLVVYGGTHCAKACERAEDCPGGSCSEGVCVPLCPSEGCPYRWE